VRQDGTGDTQYIELAIYWAQPGDTVLVGLGHYLRPPIELGPVHLMSESGPEVTILELNPQDLEQDVHVVVIQDVGECSLVGFTIKGAVNGMLSTGGGVDCNNSHALIKGNVITNNWCASGGGISCYGSPAPTIEGNLITGNQAFSGAGILVDNCSPTIANNTIVSNYASILGGSIYILGSPSHPTISGNIIASNESVKCGGMMSDTPEAQISFSCNDVWGNLPSNYCDSLPDQTGMNGNISADPQFCGINGSGNYYLRESSPCAAANVPALCGNERIGCYPVRCVVAVHKDTWGGIKSLFEGGRR
jgi:parallel beta-helix repeat protein